MAVVASAVLLIVCAAIAADMSSNEIDLQASAPIDDLSLPTLDTSAEDPLEKFTIDRAAMRANEISALDKIASDQSASSDVRDEARRLRIKLSEWMEQEATIEGVLRAQGYEGAVVTVHGGSVNVIVRSDGPLEAGAAAAILELAARESGQASGNIKIIPLI